MCVCVTRSHIYSHTQTCANTKDSHGHTKTICLLITHKLIYIFTKAWAADNFVLPERGTAGKTKTGGGEKKAEIKSNTTKHTARRKAARWALDIPLTEEKALRKIKQQRT